LKWFYAEKRKALVNSVVDSLILLDHPEVDESAVSSQLLLRDHNRYPYLDFNPLYFRGTLPGKPGERTELPLGGSTAAEGHKTFDRPNPVFYQSVRWGYPLERGWVYPRRKVLISGKTFYTLNQPHRILRQNLYRSKVFESGYRHKVSIGVAPRLLEGLYNLTAPNDFSPSILPEQIGKATNLPDGNRLTSMLFQEGAEYTVDVYVHELKDGSTKRISDPLLHCRGHLVSQRHTLTYKWHASTRNCTDLEKTPVVTFHARPIVPVAEVLEGLLDDRIGAIWNLRTCETMWRDATNADPSTPDRCTNALERAGLCLRLYNHKKSTIPTCFKSLNYQVCYFDLVDAESHQLVTAGPSLTLGGAATAVEELIKIQPANELHTDLLVGRGKNEKIMVYEQYVLSKLK